MTKDRASCGIPISKPNIDKTKSIDPKTGVERDFILVKEVIVKDDDGNIIGVEKHWQ